MRYREIHVRSVVRGKDVFRAPEYEIMKPDPHTYHVGSKDSPEVIEIPASNVGHAFLIPELNSNSKPGTASDVDGAWLDGVTLEEPKPTKGKKGKPNV